MCPFDESSLRIKERMVHVLENCGGKKLLVKSFSRSAADSNLAVPKNLRPYNILKITVAYLLFEVTQRTNVNDIVKYDFINDRLRSVRQDMTIQRLSAQQCAHLLEPMIRFYVYFGYRLHGLPPKDLDPVLHTRNLFECLKWFLKCCDSTGALMDADGHASDAEISDLMSSMEIKRGSERLACDRGLVESLYILCDLNSAHPLWRFTKLPAELKREPRVKLAASIALANRHGNFVSMTRSIARLCPLAHCAFAQYLPEMQRRAILVLTSAFSSKQRGVPAGALRRWLAFPSEEAALAACLHYGLRSQDRQVVFERASLNTDAPTHECNIRLLCSRQDLNLPHVFTYSLSEHSSLCRKS